MTLYNGDESKLGKLNTGSDMSKIIRIAHDNDVVRFKANTCQAEDCELFADWIVEYDILGKKNVKVQLCDNHSETKDGFNIEVDE